MRARDRGFEAGLEIRVAIHTVFQTESGTAQNEFTSIKGLCELSRRGAFNTPNPHEAHKKVLSKPVLIVLRFECFANADAFLSTCPLV